jgi:hypothetical protein
MKIKGQKKRVFRRQKRSAFAETYVNMNLADDGFANTSTVVGYLILTKLSG